MLLQSSSPGDISLKFEMNGAARSRAIGISLSLLVPRYQYPDSHVSSFRLSFISSFTFLSLPQISHIALTHHRRSITGQ